MGKFAAIDMIRRQGLPEDEHNFIEAMLASLVESVALGMDCERDIDHEAEIAYPSDAGLMWALNQPMSLAAVIDDVCRVLGVSAPWSVRMALGEEAQEPHPAA